MTDPYQTIQDRTILFAVIVEIHCRITGIVIAGILMFDSVVCVQSEFPIEEHGIGHPEKSACTLTCAVVDSPILSLAICYEECPLMHFPIPMVQVGPFIIISADTQ
jgi:hypothetical protein